MIAHCSTEETRVRAELAALPQPKIPTVRLPLRDKLFAALLKPIVVNPIRISPALVSVIGHTVDTFDEDRALAVAATFATNET